MLLMFCDAVMTFDGVNWCARKTKYTTAVACTYHVQVGISPSALLLQL